MTKDDDYLDNKEQINRDDVKYISKHKKRWNDILEMFPNKYKNARILDIGIGCGHMSIMTKKRFGYDVYGLDIYREEINLWKERLDKFNIKLEICDITKQTLPFADDYFDTVLLLEVLEHLITSHPPYEIFRDIRRVMRKDSYLILSTPNAVALHKRILPIFGKNPFRHGFKSEHYYKKHFMEYTGNELETFLQECEFKVEKLLYKNYLFLNSNIILKLLSCYPKFKDTIIVIARK